jgi:antirestriction protein
MMSDDVKELPVDIDESEREAWEAWLANGNDDDSAEQFRDAYVGEHLTLESYAEDFIAECYEVPEWCEYYIDYSAMVRDWQYNGDIWVEESATGGYHIFRGW